MPKYSYQLVNPVIEGTFKDVYDANDSHIAAKNMWTGLSEHIIGHVPKFMFTMRNISSGDMDHFEVSENRANSSFAINKRDITIDNKHFINFAKNIDAYSNVRNEQHGGTKRKRYDDSSSSSDSSTTDYPMIKRSSPISMFHYNTRMYLYDTYNTSPLFQSTSNPQLVTYVSPIFTPIFKPALGAFVALWP